MDYTSFIYKNKDFARSLYELYASCKEEFLQNAESYLYNLGTMDRDADNPVNGNIVLANARAFKTALMRYKASNPQMDEVEARARVVFDFLQDNGQNLSYENNAKDILFGDISRAQFYGDGPQSVFGEIIGNTNFKDRHVGDMQIICLPEINSDMPRGADELKGRVLNSGISSDVWKEIMLKRGLYHESVHAAMGTTDERKCDAFALLKIMREHPEHARLAFDVYNHCRSKIGFTVAAFHDSRNDEASMKRKIKNGTMTYVMPETYKKLEYYANNPIDIPRDDKVLMTIAYKITEKPDFSNEALHEFYNVVCRESVSKVDLAGLEVVQACMRQGGFANIDEYIMSDKSLLAFMTKKGKDMDVVVPSVSDAKTPMQISNNKERE